MAYAANLADLFRRMAVYVDKILKGAKPADLPIEQPTKFEFVVNVKTANALGTKIPEGLSTKEALEFAHMANWNVRFPRMSFNPLARCSCAFTPNA